MGVYAPNSWDSSTAHATGDAALTAGSERRTAAETGTVLEEFR
jgi:hypothetical protein